MTLPPLVQFTESSFGFSMIHSIVAIVPDAFLCSGRVPDTVMFVTPLEAVRREIDSSLQKYSYVCEKWSPSDKTWDLAEKCKMCALHHLTIDINLCPGISVQDGVANGKIGVKLSHIDINITAVSATMVWKYSPWNDDLYAILNVVRCWQGNECAV